MMKMGREVSSVHPTVPNITGALTENFNPPGATASAVARSRESAPTSEPTSKSLSHPLWNAQPSARGGRSSSSLPQAQPMTVAGISRTRPCMTKPQLLASTSSAGAPKPALTTLTTSAKLIRMAK